MMFSSGDHVLLTFIDCKWIMNVDNDSVLTALAAPIDSLHLNPGILLHPPSTGADRRRRSRKSWKHGAGSYRSNGYSLCVENRVRSRGALWTVRLESSSLSLYSLEPVDHSTHRHPRPYGVLDHVGASLRDGAFENGTLPGFM